MKQNNYLILDDEFINYCKLNSVTDINKLAIETFNRGFTILKYGEVMKNNIPKIEIKPQLKTSEIKSKSSIYDE